MKLGQYIEHLQKIILDNPEAKDYSVVYAEDEEGNRYSEVYYAPTVGSWDGDSFNTQQEFGEDGTTPVVCIN